MKINKTYRLKNAVTLNATGEKLDVIATPAKVSEIRKSRRQFDFDFIKIAEEGYTVYKLYVPDKPAIIQGLVAFRASLGILECKNMETNNKNKGKGTLYNYVGKCLVALCCKISLDYGMEGYITFEAKNRLKNYYERLGAYTVAGLRMAINPSETLKLVDYYFKID